MSEWGRMQDVLHDELDAQGYPDVKVDGIIQAIVNVRDFFPGILGQAEAIAQERERLRVAVEGLLREAQPDDWYRRGQSEMVPAYEAVLALLSPDTGGAS